jgi:hypothetical protein
MKRSIFRALATLGLGASLGSVALMAQDAIYTNIPFDFTIGAKSFAAGRYRVRQVTPVILDIRNVEDFSGTMAMTVPPGAPKTRGQAVLTFHRYGEDYFLASVSNGARAWSLPQSTTEKELMARRASPQPISVAAAVSPK